MDKWDGAAPLTRAWCVWEIFGVAKAKKPLEIALPPVQEKLFLWTLKTHYSSIIMKTSAVDVEKAQCFNPADLKAIRTAIRTESSFEMLDDIIKTQLRLWVASTGKFQVEKEERKSNPDWNEVGILASRAGATYRDQGDFANAGPLLRKALRVAEEMSEDRELDENVALQQNLLGSLFLLEKKFDEAEPVLRESLAIYKRIRGVADLVVATALDQLSQSLVKKSNVTEKRRLLEEAIAITRKLAPQHRGMAFRLSNMGVLLKEMGKSEEAEASMREALAIFKRVEGEEHPNVAHALHNLANLLNDQGKLDEAKSMYDESLRIRRKLLGASHRLMAETQDRMAFLLLKQEKFDEAESLLRQALVTSKRTYGEESGEVAEILHDLVGTVGVQGDVVEAERLFREYVRIMKLSSGEKYSDTRYASDLKYLAVVFKTQKIWDKAEALERQALAIDQKMYGNEDFKVANDLNDLAKVLRLKGKVDETVPIYRDVKAIIEKAFGKEHEHYAVSLHNLAMSLRDTKQNKEEADRLGKEALSIAEKKLGDDHSETVKYRKHWG